MGLPVVLDRTRGDLGRRPAVVSSVPFGLVVVGRENMATARLAWLLGIPHAPHQAERSPTDFVLRLDRQAQSHAGRSHVPHRTLMTPIALDVRHLGAGAEDEVIFANLCDQ